MRVASPTWPSPLTVHTSSPRASTMARSSGGASRAAPGSNPSSFSRARHSGVGGSKSTHEERFLIAGTPGGSWRVPLDGGEPALLEGFPRQRNRLDPTGRYLAGNVFAEHTTRAIHVLDLETGERHAFEPPGPEFSRVAPLGLRPRRTPPGVARRHAQRWDLETRLADVLVEENVRFFNLGPDGRSLFTWIDGTSAPGGSRDRRADVDGSPCR